MDKEEPRFMVITDDDSKVHLINLSQIAAVQQVSDEECVVVFSPDLTYTIHGKAAMQILVYCGARSVLPDGTTMAQAVEAEKKATSSE